IGDLSASRRILTICSSVNLLFLIGLSRGAGEASSHDSDGPKNTGQVRFFSSARLMSLSDSPPFHLRHSSDSRYPPYQVFPCVPSGLQSWIGVAMTG
ncbi:MAG TPA: hypothetical protein VK540_18150, partial [Polyangiaceae bacterium]|nr:hypothetical protein [Polyangiaceae bacterium]